MRCWQAMFTRRIDSRKAPRSSWDRLTPVAIVALAVLTSMESTEFFKRSREFTILGFLGDPKHGGNRNEVGWKHIGFDNLGMYKPPFGYYDAALLSGKKEE